MRIRQGLAFATLTFALAGWLGAQSVAELAQKEKERRAALKDKTERVVTNSDLAKLSKKLSVDPTVHRRAALDMSDTAAQTAAPDAKKAAAEPSPGAKPAPTPEQKAQEQTLLAEQEYQKRMTELTNKINAAQEMIDLLGLKMNTLWQEFYNTNDMKMREFVQFQISDTYEKITKAEADAAKAKKDLDDFMASSKKEGTPSIWIK